MFLESPTRQLYEEVSLKITDLHVNDFYLEFVTGFMVFWSTIILDLQSLSVWCGDERGQQ